MKTAAQLLHKWTREAEAQFPNPGKIATEPKAHVPEQPKEERES